MREFVFNMNPYSFTGSALIIGLLLVNELTPEEQSSIGNWLQLVGLTIQTYASQVSVLKTNQSPNKKQNENDSNNFEALQRAINKIQKELQKIKDHP